MDRPRQAIAQRAEAYAAKMAEEYAALLGDPEAVQLMLAAAWLEGCDAGAMDVRRMILDRLAILGEHTS